MRTNFIYTTYGKTMLENETGRLGKIENGYDYRSSFYNTSNHFNNLDIPTIDLLTAKLEKNDFDNSCLRNECEMFRSNEKILKSNFSENLIAKNLRSTNHKNILSKYSQINSPIIKRMIEDYIYNSIEKNFLTEKISAQAKFFDQIVLVFSNSVLVAGYMLFKEYASKYFKRFSNVNLAFQAVIACCILAEKILSDTPRANLWFSNAFQIELKDLNYKEALIINTINYNLEIDCDEFDEIICRATNYNNWKSLIDLRI